MRDPDRSVFFYDLGSPYAYLAAERVNAVFAEAGGQPPEWQPILLGGLFQRFGRDSWARGEGRADGMREVERRASAYGLPPLDWPDPFPGNTLVAMRAATYAKEIGRAPSFSLAAFRQAFAAGRDLSELDNVLLAAAACELHPNAVLKGIKTKSVKESLKRATDEATERGVTGIPTIAIGDELFWGDDRLEEAAEAARVAR
jgi:2-hydroxychromene-2-carboxylate isomerase